MKNLKASAVNKITKKVDTFYNVGCRWPKCKQTAKNDTYYRFPWHHLLITQLIKRYKSYKLPFECPCGGTILDEKTILTAGHCKYTIADIPVHDYFIVAGVVRYEIFGFFFLLSFPQNERKMY